MPRDRKNLQDALKRCFRLLGRGVHPDTFDMVRDQWILTIGLGRLAGGLEAP